LFHNSKLYSKTSKIFELPLLISKNNSVVTSLADYFPTLSWPDGRWCFEANVFMLELYYKGLSRKNKGGTLLTYAANISPIIRYCYYNKRGWVVSSS